MNEINKEDAVLIRLCASAMGYKYDFGVNKQRLEMPNPCLGLWVTDEDGNHIHSNWNPLDDNGLAFLLAVRFGYQFVRNDTIVPDADKPEFFRRAIVNFVAHGGYKA